MISGASRQREEKSRTLSFHAFDPDPPAVSFDNHLADHQTQSGPSVSGVFDVVALAIFFEEPANFISGYTDAVISNPYFDPSCIHKSGAHFHLPIFAGELDGVADQVTEDLVQTPRIGMNHDEETDRPTLGLRFFCSALEPDNFRGFFESVR